MDLMQDRIRAQYPGLKLDPSMANSGTRPAGSTQEASVAEFLKQLLITEREPRAERSRPALLQRATLPPVKPLKQYDFGFASGASQRKFMTWRPRCSSSVPKTSCCSVQRCG